MFPTIILLSPKYQISLMEVDMFIGRDTEMALLEELYGSEAFALLVLYGRRRVGKTSILMEFSKRHSVIFYAAQIKNDALNLTDFSKILQMHFSGSFFGTFSDWEAAFNYLTTQATSRRTTLIIDEFPYIAEANASITSILQHMIDHIWKEKNLFVILCGSSVSFMEHEVIGAKSPLYGRSTNTLELTGFDYLMSSEFYPAYSYEQKLLAYGILGGIPSYLDAFKDSMSIAQNISKSILQMGSFLRDEPQNLLKMELREPAIYNSIFEAIATGASRLNDIAQKIHEEQTKCSKYIKTLMRLKFVEKVTPCGTKESSKKTIYQITDNFFQFWYHFMFTNRSYYEILGESDASEEILEGLPEYMGPVFEKICSQYLIRLAKLRKLPFVPYSMGRWWGSNPKTRKEDDIDILVLDKQERSAIFCECKFRRKSFAMNEYQDFINATTLISKPVNRYYYVFSRSGFTEAVISHAHDDGVVLIGLDDLFNVDRPLSTH